MEDAGSGAGELAELLPEAREVGRVERRLHLDPAGPAVPAHAVKLNETPGGPTDAARRSVGRVQRSSERFRDERVRFPGRDQVVEVARPAEDPRAEAAAEVASERLDREAHPRDRPLHGDRDPSRLEPKERKTLPPWRTAAAALERKSTAPASVY